MASRQYTRYDSRIERDRDMYRKPEKRDGNNNTRELPIIEQLRSSNEKKDILIKAMKYAHDKEIELMERQMSQYIDKLDYYRNNDDKSRAMYNNRRDTYCNSNFVPYDRLEDKNEKNRRDCLRNRPTKGEYCWFFNNQNGLCRDGRRCLYKHEYDTTTRSTASPISHKRKLGRYMRENERNISRLSNNAWDSYEKNESKRTKHQNDDERKTVLDNRSSSRSKYTPSSSTTHNRYESRSRSIDDDSIEIYEVNKHDDDDDDDYNYGNISPEQVSCCNNNDIRIEKEDKAIKNLNSEESYSFSCSVTDSTDET